MFIFLSLFLLLANTHMTLEQILKKFEFSNEDISNLANEYSEYISKNYKKSGVFIDSKIEINKDYSFETDYNNLSEINREEGMSQIRLENLTETDSEKIKNESSNSEILLSEGLEKITSDLKVFLENDSENSFVSSRNESLNFTEKHQNNNDFDCISENIENDSGFENDLFLENVKNDFNNLILTVDLGGTNLKIALWEKGKINSNDIFHIINNENYCCIKVCQYPIKPEDAKNKCVFDWISEKIQKYFDEIDFKNQINKQNFKYFNSEDKFENFQIPTSMVFSYPINKISKNQAKVLNFTKEFPFRNKENDGIEIGNSLIISCKKKNINLQIKSILNDSEATFLSEGSLEKVFSIGLVLGTGTNASFILNENIIGNNSLNKSESNMKNNILLVNSEWGSFNGKCLKPNQFDEEIKNKIIASNLKYCPVDVMVGGRRNIELINLAFEKLSEFNLIKNHSQIDLLIESNENFEKIYFAIIRRNQSIIVGLILGILRNQKIHKNIKVNLILNGSAYSDEKNIEMLKSILNGFDLDLNIIFHAEASLRGALVAAIN